jgi:hypothetical protein
MTLFHLFANNTIPACVGARKVLSFETRFCYALQRT